MSGAEGAGGWCFLSFGAGVGVGDHPPALGRRAGREVAHRVLPSPALPGGGSTAFKVAL